MVVEVEQTVMGGGSRVGIEVVERTVVCTIIEDHQDWKVPPE